MAAARLSIQYVRYAAPPSVDFTALISASYHPLRDSNWTIVYYYYYFTLGIYSRGRFKN